MSNIVRSPEVIAAEINAIKSQTSGILAAAIGYAKQSCFEIGKRLEEAKALVPHGEWGAWLSENFEYSESTAGNLMRIYREFGDDQINLLTGKSDAETFETLSQSQLVELFALPKPMRAEFVETHREELERGEMSVREMRDLIKEQKRALDEKDAEIARKDAEIVENDESYAELVTQLRAAEADASRLDGEREDLAAKVRAAEQKAQEAEERAGRADAEIVALKNAPKEKVVETVTETVYAPTEEQIAEIRAEAIREAEERHKNDIERLSADLKERDAHHEQVMKEAQEETAMKIRQLIAKSDPHASRISYAMEAISRALSDVKAELTAMEEETPGSGQKMRLRCESTLLGIINRAGFQV